MATNLYQILGIEATASPEEVRRAYKKRALQTHPDRLPQGSTPQDKARAEEEFRQVNNAYEVLRDPQKRKEFDLHGVYPPPAEAASSTSSRHHHTQGPYSRPSGRHYRPHHASMPFPHFVFMDPFKLFDEFFSEFERDPLFSRSGAFMSDPFRNSRSDPFAVDPFSHLDSLFPSPFGSPFGNRSLFSSPFGLLGPPSSMFDPLDSHSRPLMTDQPQQQIFRSSSTVMGGNGQYVSEEKYQVTTDKGTETVHKRRDWNGDEHVTKTYPDGRQSYRINGVKQPSGKINQQLRSTTLPAALPGVSSSPWGSNIATSSGSRHNGAMQHYSSQAPPPSYHEATKKHWPWHKKHGTQI